MKCSLDKPCSECPFRKESAAGWLGPWEPRELLNSLAHTPFPCHRALPPNAEQIPFEKLEGCIGAAIFLNRKIERSRNPEQKAMQDHVAGLELPPEVIESVFQWASGFMDHHAPGWQERGEWL